MKQYEDHYYVTEDGRIYSTKTNKWLTGKIDNGYQRIWINGKTKRLHRIVAEAYIPNPHQKPQVNHIDGDKLNNHVDNLEWCSHYENMRHAAENGLRPKQNGKEHGNFKGTIYNSNGESFDGVKELKEGGYTYQSVYNVINGKQKTHKGLNWWREKFNSTSIKNSNGESFNGEKELEEAGYCPGAVYAVIRGERKTHREMKWWRE